MTVYDGDKQDGWNEYLLYGGLPPVALQKTEEEKVRHLNSLLTETYMIDVINRNRDKERCRTQRFIQDSRIGNWRTYQSATTCQYFPICKECLLSSATIKKYIEYLADAFLLEPCNRYDVKGRKYYRNAIEILFF